jgi:hypothetical protein
MAQSKGEDELADTVGFLAVIAMILVVIAYFVLVLLSLVISIWALFAWNKPRTIWGHTMLPHEARTFIYRGLGGAALLPIVTFLVSLWTGGQIESGLWVRIVLGGYGLGSVALTLLEEEVRASAPAACGCSRRAARCAVEPIAGVARAQPGGGR